MLAGPVTYAFIGGRELFRSYREYTAAAPDKHVFLKFLTVTPPTDGGSSLFDVYVGPIEVGEDVVRPIRGFEPPLRSRSRQ